MENGITEVTNFLHEFMVTDPFLAKVGHNHETTQNVTWCKGEGCYTLELEYTVPDAKIDAIISMSEHCEQQILFQVISLHTILVLILILSVQNGSSEKHSIWSVLLWLVG